MNGMALIVYKAELLIKHSKTDVSIEYEGRSLFRCSKQKEHY